jgi:hypothetical protein
MKSSILRAGVALACALGLSACGGGDGDLYLTGTVYNVTADGLVLQNNNGDDLAIASGSSTFTFGNRVSTDDQFNITVKSIPTNASGCVVSNGSARANYYTIAQISVTCVIKTHTMTVAITGLKATSSGLILLNGSDKKEVAAGATTSQAMTDVYEGAAYGITVYQNPTDSATGTKQSCTVSGGDTGTGTGTMGSEDLNGKVIVNCV